jgi:hypothetical protein
MERPFVEVKHHSDYKWDEQPQAKKPFYKRFLFWVLLILSLGVSVIVAYVQSLFVNNIQY